MTEKELREFVANRIEDYADAKHIMNSKIVASHIIDWVRAHTEIDEAVEDKLAPEKEETHAWEYHIISDYPGFADRVGTLYERMEILGAEGWELVAIKPDDKRSYPHYIFKRPKV
jgi:hypothetical protein